MGHRGYTNRAKSGDRALVGRQRQLAARAALVKQRERSRTKQAKNRPKAKIVVEPSEPKVADQDGGRDEND